MTRTLSVVTVALILLASSVAALRGSPSDPAPSTLTAADARLRAALAYAATADRPAPDAERQNARLVAADAALTEMAGLPADDRTGLAVKASALLFVASYEVQDGWKLGRSLAADTLRLDAKRACRDAAAYQCPP